MDIKNLSANEIRLLLMTMAYHNLMMAYFRTDNPVDDLLFAGVAGQICGAVERNVERMYGVTVEELRQQIIDASDSIKELAS